MRSVLLGALALGCAALLPATASQAQSAVASAPAATPAAYMAANVKQPGVKALPDGLQYRVVQSGPAGPSPKEGDAIKVHYEGKLIDGTVFDSSFARGKPVLMPLGNLIPAWMEALPMMHVGDEWMLYVPPELGYGAEGGGPIPPNSVLVFRIKLLGMLAAD